MPNAEMSSLVLQAKEDPRRAEVQDRDLSPAERSEFEALLDAASEQRGAEDGRRDIGHLSAKLGPMPGEVIGGWGLTFEATGLGDQFIESKGYKSTQDPASRPQTWTSGPVELKATARRASPRDSPCKSTKADDGSRTRDPRLGNTQADAATMRSWEDFPALRKRVRVA